MTTLTDADGPGGVLLADALPPPVKLSGPLVCVGCNRRAWALYGCLCLDCRERKAGPVNPQGLELTFGRCVGCRQDRLRLATTLRCAGCEGGGRESTTRPGGPG